MSICMCGTFLQIKSQNALEEQNREKIRVEKCEEMLL